MVVTAETVVVRTLIRMVTVTSILELAKMTGKG
jgi:hypothetical protein